MIHLGVNQEKLTLSAFLLFLKAFDLFIELQNKTFELHICK